MTNIGVGYEVQPGGEPERRALFDLRRQVAKLQAGGGGGVAPPSNFVQPNYIGDWTVTGQYVYGHLVQFFGGWFVCVVPQSTVGTWENDEWVQYTPGQNGHGIASSPWIDPTMQNGWVAYGAGYSSPQYRKVGDIVYVRGSIKSGTLGSAAFTLPLGFRPLLAEVQACRGVSGLVAIALSATGTVTPATQHGATNAAVALDGIQFSITP